jgi:hypothetical protein
LGASSRLQIPLPTAAHSEAGSHLLHIGTDTVGFLDSRGDLGAACSLMRIPSEYPHALGMQVLKLEAAVRLGAKYSAATALIL